MRGHLRLLAIGLACLLLAALAGATRAYGGSSPIDVTNVAKLKQTWTGLTGGGGLQFQSPVVANGYVYVEGSRGLLAYAPKGLDAYCWGKTRQCQPVWVGPSGEGDGTPAVSGGKVYVTLPSNSALTVLAFDAAGKVGCKNASPPQPRTCGPLWGGHTDDIIFGSPAVANGVVYAGSYDHKLYAFSAAGTTNCSGTTPKKCAPLWTGATSRTIEGSPAVSGGVVYIASDDQHLYAYDAAGTTHCSGTPKTCRPLWTAKINGGTVTRPAVANGVVYTPSFDHNLYAFSAAGTTKCSGEPKKCLPLWTARIGSSSSSPAVSGGVVYIGSDNHKLYAFSAAGTTNCSGTPKVCQPLWTANTGGKVWSSPRVSNGLVFIGSDDHRIRAFSAAGTTKCAGTPKVCQPLWNALTGGRVQTRAAPAADWLYVGSGDGNVYAYTIP